MVLIKNSNTKPIARWYRRSILISAFDDKILNDPYVPCGGSFTDPLNHMAVRTNIDRTK